MPSSGSHDHVGSDDGLLRHLDRDAARSVEWHCHSCSTRAQKHGAADRGTSARNTDAGENFSKLMLEVLKTSSTSSVERGSNEHTDTSVTRIGHTLSTSRIRRLVSGHQGIGVMVWIQLSRRAGPQGGCRQRCSVVCHRRNEVRT